jgi:hypothetical protein
MSKVCPPGCIPSVNIQSKLILNYNKICPSDKIYNPKTNRCVSKNGLVGKLLSKKTIKFKVKASVKAYKGKDPLPKKYQNLVDKGMVGKDVNLKLQELSNKIGEISDVYSVAKGKKDLATLDFSSLGKRKLKKKDIILINKVIDYCNYKGVQMLHNTKNGGMYLKTIFFLPHNYNKALKLMKILWYSESSIPYNMHNVSIGLLLGYDIDNIIYISHRDNFYITKKDVLSVQKKIDKMKVTLEELQGTYKIVHKITIPNL